jgi:hypothetical protein
MTKAKTDLEKLLEWSKGIAKHEYQSMHGASVTTNHLNDGTVVKCMNDGSTEIIEPEKVMTLVELIKAYSLAHPDG